MLILQQLFKNEHSCESLNSATYSSAKINIGEKILLIPEINEARRTLQNLRYIETIESFNEMTCTWNVFFLTYDTENLTS